MYGVRMTPAHPWYVGRGDDKCGGEVVYSIQDIRQLLSVQPEDVKRWLTTSEMGWALKREENEVANEKNEREGKPVARQLAPMISKFIRAQWESKEMENVDDERRQLLEEAMELDHIWSVWEELHFIIFRSRRDVLDCSSFPLGCSRSSCLWIRGVIDPVAHSVRLF
jgi:hypothetical protein